MCQDTGTAIVMGKKGQFVFTGGGDEEAIARGVFDTYQTTNLRYSQMAPLDMYDEKNTGTNLPAQIEIYAIDGDAYKFLFMAKGGGSANKSYLFQETKALLNPATPAAVPRQDAVARHRGLPAVPPRHRHRRHLGRVHAQDRQARLGPLPRRAARPRATTVGHGVPRPRARGSRSSSSASSTGIGAQFGGKYFCHDVRVIRLPRHGASLPGRHRRVVLGRPPGARQDHRRRRVPRAARDRPGAASCPRSPTSTSATPTSVHIDLNRPMAEIRAELSQYPVKTRLSLTGPMVVARDIAHAKLKERLDAGEGLPQYLKDHAVYYAGPAKTPEGYASGSFGPTTAGRMDSYVEQFQAAGGQLVMLAKGNRSKQVTDACKKHGGFYLGSIGGPAARLAQDCIKQGRGARVPRARHGGGVEDRGRGLPGVHRRRRQGQRLLRRRPRRRLDARLPALSRRYVLRGV